MTKRPKLKKQYEWFDQDGVAYDNLEKVVIKEAIPKNLQCGWICAKCGASLSPFTASCPYCAPVQKIEITCEM